MGPLVGHREIVPGEERMQRQQDCHVQCSYWEQRCPVVLRALDVLEDKRQNADRSVHAPADDEDEFPVRLFLVVLY